MASKLKTAIVVDRFSALLRQAVRHPTLMLAAYTFLMELVTIISPFSFEHVSTPSTINCATPSMGVPAGASLALSSTIKLECGGGTIRLRLINPFALFSRHLPRQLMTFTNSANQITPAPLPMNIITADQASVWKGKPGQWPKHRFTFKAFGSLGIFVDIDSGQTQAPGISGWTQYHMFYVVVIPWWFFWVIGSLILLVARIARTGRKESGFPIIESTI
jgi:hypothetical protein